MSCKYVELLFSKISFDKSVIYFLGFPPAYRMLFRSLEKLPKYLSKREERERELKPSPILRGQSFEISNFRFSHLKCHYIITKHCNYQGNTMFNDLKLFFSDVFLIDTCFSILYTGESILNSKIFQFLEIKFFWGSFV